MDKKAKMAQSIVGTSPGRPKHDFYPTPPIGTEKLLGVENFHGNIWEPACGDGAMSKVLEDAGYMVYSSDLIDYGYKDADIGNFLAYTTLEEPNIVTNPPFILAQEFAEHAFGLGADKVALLCKLAFLEGQKRATWLETTPLKKVHVFKKRLTLYRNGVKMKNSGMIAFAWFVWEKNWNLAPRVGWI